MSPGINGLILRQPTGDPRDPIVLLDYGDPSLRRAHHVEQRPQVSDRLRQALLRAEGELMRLEILFEHIEVSELGAERICWALHTIRAYLAMERPTLGLAPVEVATQWR